MKKSLITAVALALVLVVATAAFAVGNGQGPPPDKVPFLTDVDVTVVSSGDHGEASPPYKAADPILTLDLGEGSWIISASGGMNFAGTGSSPNAGLRIADDVVDYVMLAKQNIASENDANVIGISRGGFCVVGAVVVGAGEGPVTVELVAYGGTVFDENMVAIGGPSVGFDLQE